jgi:hypothetical protein
MNRNYNAPMANDPMFTSVNAEANAPVEGQVTATYLGLGQISKPNSQPIVNFSDPGKNQQNTLLSNNNHIKYSSMPPSGLQNSGAANTTNFQNFNPGQNNNAQSHNMNNINTSIGGRTSVKGNNGSVEGSFDKNNQNVNAGPQYNNCYSNSFNFVT